MILNEAELSMCLLLLCGFLTCQAVIGRQWLEAGRLEVASICSSTFVHLKEAMF